MTDNKGGASLSKQEIKKPSFEIILDRLDRIESQQNSLATRAFEKSSHINSTESGLNENHEQRTDNLINAFHNIMDKMENNNNIMRQVVNDLEDAIL